MLKVSEIEVRYSGVPVIHNVSLEVNQGELVSVVGANGAGKSTLLKAIAGALHPSQGSIQFDHQEISRFSTADIVRKGITYVPEARLIFGPLTVEENLELGAYILDDAEEVKKNLEYVYRLFPDLLRDVFNKVEPSAAGAADARHRKGIDVQPKTSHAR